MSRITERSHKGYTFRYWESDKGTTYANVDCERHLEYAIWAVSRWFARTVQTRTTYPPGEDADSLQQTVRWKLDKLMEHVSMMQKQLDEIEGIDRTVERIAALRKVEGRTPEESAMFLAKASEIEKKLP